MSLAFIILGNNFVQCYLNIVVKLKLSIKDSCLKFIKQIVWVMAALIVMVAATPDVKVKGESGPLFPEEQDDLEGAELGFIAKIILKKAIKAIAFG